MPATKINISGINELDLNLNGTTTATTSQGVTTINNSPAIATSSTVGVVKPDNNTIQVQADGTLIAAGPAPSFVQGASASTVAPTMAVGLTGISLGNTLLLHIHCGNSTAPTFSGIGNAYVLIRSVWNSFWGIGNYTYICYGALANTDTITFTGLAGGFGNCILAEYTPASAYEAVNDNGVTANAATSSSLAITSTKNYERAIFFFSCGAFSGQTPNQTQRVPTSGASQIMLMDGPCPNAGTTITGTVLSAAMNNPSITGFFLSGLGQVQSVGLSMPSDFTVVGSPVLSTGVLQVTGGVTKSSIQQESLVYSADTGAANAYAVTLSPTPTVIAGSEIVFKAANANTGASTVTVNGTSYPLTKNGTTALQLGDIVAGQIVTAKCDGTNFQIPGSGGGGSGSVTSVGLSAPAEFTVSGSPVTSTGTLALAKASQAANVIYAGPSTGSSAAPTFRSMVAADLPQSAVGGGIVTGSTSALSLTGTVYLPIGGGGFSSGTEANVDIDAPATSTISNFFVQLSAAPGVGNSVSFTIRKNGIDTAVTCTISGTNTSANDTSHTLSVAQGDLLTIKVVPTGTIVATPNVLTSLQWGTAGGGTSSYPLTVVQEATYQSGGSNVTSFTVTFPSAAAASGNTMFLIIACDGSSVVTIPTGWTSDFNQQQSTFARLILCHKATAGESSATMTVASASSFGVYFFEVAGTHALDVKSSAGTANTSQIVLPSITPAANSVVFGMACVVLSGTVASPTQFATESIAPTWKTLNISPPFSISGRLLCGHVSTVAATNVSTKPPVISLPNTNLLAGAGIAYATFSIL